MKELEQHKTAGARYSMHGLIYNNICNDCDQRCDMGKLKNS